MQDLRNGADLESPEIAKFNDFALPSVDLGKAYKRLVKGQ